MRKKLKFEEVKFAESELASILRKRRRQENKKEVDELNNFNIRSGATRRLREKMHGSKDF